MTVRRPSYTHSPSTFVHIRTVCCPNNPPPCHLSELKLEKTNCGGDHQFFVILNFDHSGNSECFHLTGNGHNYGEFRYGQLPLKIGIQAGYTAPVSVLNYISAYGNFTWQAGIHEQFIAARYIHHFNDTSNNAFSFGIGYRATDALVPDAALEIGKSRVVFWGKCPEH